jgi:hypothetical protein
MFPRTVLPQRFPVSCLLFLQLFYNTRSYASDGAFVVLDGTFGEEGRAEEPETLGET